MRGELAERVGDGEERGNEEVVELGRVVGWVLGRGGGRGRAV